MAFSSCPYVLPQAHLRVHHAAAHLEEAGGEQRVRARGQPGVHDHRRNEIERIRRALQVGTGEGARNVNHLGFYFQLLDPGDRSLRSEFLMDVPRLTKFSYKRITGTVLVAWSSISSSKTLVLELDFIL